MKNIAKVRADPKKWRLWIPPALLHLSSPWEPQFQLSFAEGFHTSQSQLRPPQQHPKSQAVSTIHLWNHWISFRWGKKSRPKGPKLKPIHPRYATAGSWEAKRFRNAWKTCVRCRNHHLSYTYHGLFAVEDDFFLVKTLGATDFELIAGSSRIF